MHVRFIGEDEYHGTDQGADNKPVDLLPGQSADVSDEKAAQLEADFPDDFEFDVDPGEDEVQTEPTASTAKELMALKRDKLDDMAAAAGVDAPGDLPNKRAVVEAILRAQADD